MWGCCGGPAGWVKEVVELVKIGGEEQQTNIMTKVLGWVGRGRYSKEKGFVDREGRSDKAQRWLGDEGGVRG